MFLFLMVMVSFKVVKYNYVLTSLGVDAKTLMYTTYTYILGYCHIIWSSTLEIFTDTLVLYRLNVAEFVYS